MSTVSNVVPLRGTKTARPSIENGKVPPLRRPNKDLISREYLTAAEVDQLLTAARSAGRHNHSDSTLMLLALRQALRVYALAALR